MQRAGLAPELGERIGAEIRTIRITVEDMDRDLAAQQVRQLLAEKDQRIGRIERWPAGDIDEMEGRASCAKTGSLAIPSAMRPATCCMRRRSSFIWDYAAKRRSAG
jgi:hypothetical protein